MRGGRNRIFRSRRSAPWRLAATVWLLVSAIRAADPGTVDGLVRNSVTGLPVNDAVVRLIFNGSGQRGYVGTSDATGAFHFANVEPGPYRITLERTGFTATDEMVTVNSGQDVRGVQLDAAPLAVITGRVLDSDGTPVPGAEVQAIGCQWILGKRLFVESTSAQADETGQFRLSGIEPGRYRLFAAAPNDNPLRFSISEGPGKPEYHLASSYYPAGQDLDGASPLDLSAGQELGGIELKLPLLQSFHIRGRAAVSGQSLGEPDFLNATRMDNGRPTFWFAGCGILKRDGSFDCAGLVPGVYVLSVNRFNEMLTESVTVPVSKSDVNGVLLAKLRPAKLLVRFTFAGDPAPKHAEPVLELHRDPAGAAAYAGQFWSQPHGTSQPDGTLLFENLAPGRYVPLLPPNSELYVQAVAFNGQDLPDGELDLPPNSAGQLDVTLAAATGSVAGIARDAGKGRAVLVAENAGPGNSPVRLAGIDPDGRFSLPNLPPGRYLLFAIPRDGDWPWQNAQFVTLLHDRAAEVELAEKGHAQAEASLVAAETLRQAEEQIP